MLTKILFEFPKTHHTVDETCKQMYPKCLLSWHPHQWMGKTSASPSCCREFSSDLWESQRKASHESPKQPTSCSQHEASFPFLISFSGSSPPHRMPAEPFRCPAYSKNINVHARVLVPDAPKASVLIPGRAEKRTSMCPLGHTTTPWPWSSSAPVQSLTQGLLNIFSSIWPSLSLSILSQI